MTTDRPVGVFDSGIGGLSILQALRAELPAERYVYVADTAYAPYGERGDAYVVERSRAIVRALVERHGIRALVIACNTATAAAIHLLRAEYPALPIVGVEPALKPALALSRTRRIGVLATRGTLASAKFRALHDGLAAPAEFVCQPCDGLAEAIERQATDTIAALCREHVGALGHLGTAPGEIDTVVLGCTHYPLVSAQVRAAAGAGVQLVDTGHPVAQQARRVLSTLGPLAVGAGELALLTTGEPGPLQAAARHYLGADTAAQRFTS